MSLQYATLHERTFQRILLYLNSVLNSERILLSFLEFCVELFTHQLHLTKQNMIFSWVRGVGGGRFPIQFSSSIFFLLLASCLFFLHFEASLNSSFDIELWSRQERDKEVCRRKSISDCFLFSFVLQSFQKNHKCTTFASQKVLSLIAPYRGIYHSSPVLKVC